MVPVFGVWKCNMFWGRDMSGLVNVEDLCSSSSLQTMTPWLIACSLQWANWLVGVPTIPSKCGSTKPFTNLVANLRKCFKHHFSQIRKSWCHRIWILDGVWWVKVKVQWNLQNYALKLLSGCRAFSKRFPFPKSILRVHIYIYKYMFFFFVKFSWAHPLVSS